MAKVKMKWTGVSPLIMHSSRLANPMDPIARELKQITRPTKKTDEIYLQMQRVEWFGGLYTEGGRVVVPVDNVLASIGGGSRTMKLGKKFAAGTVCEVASFPLIYKGPKDPEALFEDGSFMDFRSVALNGKRVMRSRPVFRNWSLKVELLVNPELISEEDVIRSATIAGEQVGLCEFRPEKSGRYGRFTVEVN